MPRCRSAPALLADELSCLCEHPLRATRYATQSGQERLVDVTAAIVDNAVSVFRTPGANMRKSASLQKACLIAQGL